MSRKTCLRRLTLWFLITESCILICSFSLLINISAKCEVADNKTDFLPSSAEPVSNKLFETPKRYTYNADGETIFTQVRFSNGFKTSSAGDQKSVDEFETLRVRDLSSSKQFPSEEICPYLSIRVRSAEDSMEDQNTTCQTGRVVDSDCEFILKYVGKPRALASRSCSEGVTTQMKPLCWFGHDYRTNPEDTAGLQCSTQSCEHGVVYLGVFNTSLGRVLPDDDWPRFSVGKELERAIGDMMGMQDANHFRFCFIRCVVDRDLNKTLNQILVFPPILEESTNTARPGRINVNIVVEDAVSRPHFYRSLPKTVDALRGILRNSSVSATILDFEKYQSYDSSTHSNVRRLFAGVSDAGTITTGIKELYQKFKKAGYRTMFQEDVCWYDGFGSLLRPTGTPEDDPAKQWAQFRRLLSEHVRPFVDTFGVGFSACKILRDLGDTNIFNGENLPALCFDGRHLSSYFLKTTKDFLDLRRPTSGRSPDPLFSYTHLNTGHEHTAKRIVNDDDNLARFVSDMAEHSNTLTILLSDHGAKTSEYATRTVQGLKEIYKPFLFMIIPRQVAEFLGRERMRNLIANQKRLVALEDLNLALHDLAAVNTNSRGQNPAATVSNQSSKSGGKSSGLFSELSANRSCAHFKLSADAVCQCEGEDVAVELDEFFLNFLANTAVGEINNLIQSQHTKGKIVRSKIMDNEPFAGYGRCRRYVLKRVERVRSKVRGEHRLTTFTIVVETQPLTDEGEEETFEVTLRYRLAPVTHGFSVVKTTRTSRYGVFQACADRDVDLHLCACDRTTGSVKTLENSADYIWRLFGYYMFSRRTKIRKLHGACLYLIKTQLTRALRNGDGEDASLLYEVLNVCDKKLFNVTVSEDSLVRQPFLLSRPLPFSIAVYPNAMHYVISALCGLPNGEFVANFEVDVADLA